MTATLSHIAESLCDLYTHGDDLELTGLDKGRFMQSILKEYYRLPFYTCFLSIDPGYDGWQDMAADIRDHSMLTVDDRHPPSYWGREFNSRLRAVHDWHHVQSQSDFSLAGEIKAFAHHCKTLESSLHQRILFSEVVLQAAVTHHTENYPVQRLVSVPYGMVALTLKLAEVI